MVPDPVVQQGAWLPHLWIRGDRFDRDIEHYRATGLQGVEVDGELLERVIPERPRHVSVRGLKDDARLEALYAMPWLEEISGYGEDNYRPAIDWSRFPQLRMLHWNWTPRLRFPTEMPGLEYLDLMGMKLDPGQPTGLPAELPSLRTLRVGYFGHRPRIPSLPRAPRLAVLELWVAHTADLTPLLAYPTLERLTLAHLPRLTDLAPLARLPELTALEIRTCNRLNDLSPLAACPKLRRLTVHDGRVASLRWVDARRIDRVELRESATVEDGDMAPLIGVDAVSFPFRAHYSHREEQVRAAHPTFGGVPALVQWTQGTLRFTLPSTGPCEVEVEGLELPIVLWNVPGPTDRRVPENVVRYLEGAGGWDGLARDALRRRPPEVVRYLRHHGLSPTPEALGRLELARVAVLDDAEGLTATLDYTVGTSRTQYVLAVRFDADAQVKGVHLES